MEESNKSSEAARCAVVTGANKGIGLEICRQLATKGVMVILTARDESNGIKATENLKASGASNVVFHQLDVKNPASIASLVKFIQTHFGKLDILVNNAGASGLGIDYEAFRAFTQEGGTSINDENAPLVSEFMVQTYEKAVDCLKTNYYGTRLVTEALLPLLHLSDSPTLVNVSSVFGQLKLIYNEKVKSELENIESLSEEKIDEIVQCFLRDFKEDELQANGWPITAAAYKVSKVALNAYTRVLARRHTHIRVNCVHPGYVKTDISCNTGNLTPEEGARGPVMLALLPKDGPSGLYFDEMQPSTF